MVRFLFSLVLLVCFQEEEPVLTWETDYKLKWTDFKAEPNYNDDAVAITASGISFGFSITQTDKKEVVSFSTEVFAYFYPNQSWYKVERANNHILKHEQLHFDITELHARKFRYRISQIKMSSQLKEQLSKVHTNINQELSEMQNKYDSETNNSRAIEAQKTWEQFIAVELKKYSNYKSN